LIYNAGGGTAAEVVAIIDELKGRVEREFGFALEEEVQFIGFDNRESH
jgi:UDP-N-acetylmuramate dehydrogenase